MINTSAVLLLAATLFMCSGCGGGENVNANANANAAGAAGNASAKTNVEELALLIRVPYEVEDIVWNADGERVLAVLRFSPEITKNVISAAQAYGEPQRVSVAFETWFPDELTAQSDMSGDSTLKGTAYGANDFYNEPFTRGRLVKIDDVDHFVLELTSK